MINFYSASSNTVNSKKAITECLENASGGGNILGFDIIIIYTTMGHNFRDILTEAQKLCPHAQVVGCTCSGVIGKEGVSESMRALGIMAVKGEKKQYALASRDNIVGENSYEVSAQLARELKKSNPHVNMILFFASGIDISADQAIKGIESVYGSEIPLFGATSSDNMKALISFQFIGNRILERGALAIGFADPTLEVITQATHGFAVVGMPFEVTRSKANRIFELNGQSPWKFLTDRLGLPVTVELSDIIPVGAIAEELSQELQEEYGNTHILRVITKKEADESIYMPVDSPVGTKLWLTVRDEKKIFDGLDQAVKQILKKCHGRRPLAVFHADCGARGRLLFNRIVKDEIISRMQVPLCENEDVPWLGMYGFGEFAQLGGHNQFHNYTTALYVIVRR